MPKKQDAELNMQEMKVRMAYFRDKIRELGIRCAEAEMRAKDASLRYERMARTISAAQQALTVAMVEFVHLHSQEQMTDDEAISSLARRIYRESLP